MKQYLAVVWLVVFYALLGHAVPASAQVATPVNHLGWTEVAQVPAVAGAASYNLYVDAVVAPLPLTGVVCVAGNPTTGSDCTSNIPALTVGQHTVTVTQVIISAESGKSNTLSFTMVIVVTPSGLVLKP